MKRHIASEAKQGKVGKNHAMHAFVIAPNHSSHGGNVGVIGMLVGA
jgi:hypothetical protein